MQVANVTTPANYFHILRRQMTRDFRKPLVIMTPKSLLRHKSAVSTIDEFTGDSSFHRVLFDPNAPADADVKRLVLCSGKVSYELFDGRDEAGDKNTAILRVEQLYPFPTDVIVERLKTYSNVETVVWAQEEPRNQGAWSFVEELVEQAMVEAGSKPKRPVYAGRAASASTAAGSAKRFAAEQKAVVADALGHSDTPALAKAS
jgi:2-oxoglutarate dehydrogenase E1 component